jgi:hypothetical protein
MEDIKRKVNKVYVISSKLFQKLLSSLFLPPHPITDSENENDNNFPSSQVCMAGQCVNEREM